MESLTFMMGEFAAEFPADRLYAKNHMWALPVESSQPVVTRFYRLRCQVVARCIFSRLVF